MQAARNRRRRQRQHIHLLAHPLQPLLVRHPEPLLLVHDDQPKLLEPHIPLYQSVRPDTDVHLPLSKPVHHAPLLLRRPKAAQHLNPRGKRAQPLRECRIMLLRQHRRRHQHRHLLPVHHRLERRPQRNLRLPVPHIAAHQPVHRLRRLHISLNFLDSPALVRRLLERERLLQFRLPLRVRHKRMTLRKLPRRIQRQQFRRHLHSRAFSPRFRPSPLLRSQPSQARRPVHRRDVRRNPVKMLQRHIQLVVIRVLDGKILAVVFAVITGDSTGAGVSLHAPHRPREPADAMLHMHHIVPRRQF